MDNEVFNHKTKCAIKSIHIEDKNTITFKMPQGHCTDYGGAEEMAKFILPTVTKIKTYAGKYIDTVYNLKDGKWLSTVYPPNIDVEVDE